MPERVARELNKMKPVYISTIIVLTCLALTACSSISVDNRKENVKSIATNAGFSGFSIQTDGFRLAGFSRIVKPISDLTIYIEGDGLAWLDRYTVSSNPTPKNPVALKLAILDPNNGVVYLGRPCQYVNLKTEKNCNSKYWTSHRFAEQIIDSYQQAIDTLLKTYKANGAHLVGFSGGGAIAALVAAKRKDILSLRTVAGNLDHIALSKHHRASILKGSLNPITVAASTNTIPQIHYSGGRDEIVPEWIANSFSTAANGKTCSQSQTLPTASHSSGWENAWNKLIRAKPKCKLQ